MIVHAVSPQAWNQLAPDAHRVLFNEERPAKMNTFDFCLVVATMDQIQAYSTIIEMDAETAYMQHGGAMPGVKGTVLSKKTYQMMVDWLKGRYKRITTRIQNKNIAMLKFALSEGLIVVGCDCYPDGVYLHLRYGDG